MHEICRLWSETKPSLSLKSKQLTFLLFLLKFLFYDSKTSELYCEPTSQRHFIKVTRLPTGNLASKIWCCHTGQGQEVQRIHCFQLNCR